jgi:class 3 adenylate cyclase
MPLRLRLFIYIGAAFLVIMISAFFIEHYFISRSLLKATNNLKENINKLNEEKVQHLEAYIQEYLLEYRTDINAILTLIKKYPELRLSSSKQKINDVWLNSAALLTNHTWLDLVEHINESKEAASILVESSTMPQISLHEMVPNLKVVVLYKGGKKPVFVAAIPWSFQQMLSNDQSRLVSHVEPEDSVDVYVLFKLETLLHMDVEQLRLQALRASINPLYPFLEWTIIPTETSMAPSYIQRLKVAQETLKEHLQELSDDEVVKKVLAQRKELLASTRTQENSKLDTYINRYEQIGLLWDYATAIASGNFNRDPFHENAPIGMIRTEKGSQIGNLLLRREVFFKKPFSLDKEQTFKENGLKDEIRVITFKDGEIQAFFGNTLTLIDHDQFSQITLGMRADTLSKELALVTHKRVLFIANHELVSVFDREGQKQFNQTLSSQDMDTLLTLPYGKIVYKGEKDVFLRVMPFKDQDFHFCILSPQEEEFFLVDNLSSMHQALIEKISWQMVTAGMGTILIILFLLNRIAKRVTKPIVTLAGATQNIKAGQFEEAFNIQNIKIEPYQDEVATLYQAFSEMVQGLKEKEKVRGILNKVVSTEIANEILKKDLYLGGEEKEVTVFFSDIRNFTSITENMQPHDVVTLLNTCMTKVSNVIDEYEGVIDKYVGDEVMALFGAPLSCPDSTLKAVLCAIEVMQSLKVLNKESPILGKILEMGIGIHRGKALIGNMGAENRLNYTVLGANVNLAARLCSKARGNEIVISKQVYQEIAHYNRVEVEEIPPFEVKGFSTKIEAYRVLGYKKKS